ncbi:MAG: CZB domain-containing protein [Solidesulfovibrio sp. DCME]|uniref:CZB domain-containing protein n=1 Tax=Solidesulfovibrio sp. DCME TaxID=3447380 RepID=UPI003D0D2CB0
MDRLADLVSIATTAAEEQSQASGEITENLERSATRLHAVNGDVAESLATLRRIGGEVARLSTHLDDIATTALQVRAGAGDLANLGGKRAATLARYQTGPAPFDIGRVKAMHLAWRARLEAVIAGHLALDPARIDDHHQCAFGQWYDAAAREQGLGGRTLFREVGASHARVHGLAREVAELVANGRRERLGAVMAAFEREREALFEALDALYREMSR